MCFSESSEDSALTDDIAKMVQGMSSEKIKAMINELKLKVNEAKEKQKRGHD